MFSQWSMHSAVVTPGRNFIWQRSVLPRPFSAALLSLVQCLLDCVKPQYLHHFSGQQKPQLYSDAVE